MAEDQIKYDVMTQEALRGVVRSVLEQIAKKGLPGEHPVYIAFDTHGPGVSVSDRLKQQYPDEMTIVLQHQFWDLDVTQERFDVKLSFNNVPERLIVPFAAIKAFYDPSVQFGLQFGGHEAANDAANSSASLPGMRDEKNESADLPAVAEGTGGNAGDAAAPAANADAHGVPPGGGLEKVVELDAFRKK